MITPAQVAAEARRWIGAPFAWQGRSRVGLDCGGLPAVVGRALGIVDEEPPRYRLPLPPGYLVEALRRYAIQREHQRELTGCGTARCCDECKAQLAGTIVVLGRNQQHCGIVTDDGMLIAVHHDLGCTSVPFERALLRSTRAVFEFPGVMY